MASNPVYLEIVDFFASGTTPQSVADFQPSQAAQERARVAGTGEARPTDAGAGIQTGTLHRTGTHTANGEGSRPTDPRRSAVTWPEAVRERVESRAFGRCEYCLLAKADAGLPHEIDHVISRKHGGTSNLEDLALAFYLCNRSKGSDIASRYFVTGELMRLFHPRLDRWLAADSAENSVQGRISRGSKPELSGLLPAPRNLSGIDDPPLQFFTHSPQLPVRPDPSIRVAS